MKHWECGSKLELYAPASQRTGAQCRQAYSVAGMGGGGKRGAEARVRAAAKAAKRRAEREAERGGEEAVATERLADVAVVGYSGGVDEPTAMEGIEVRAGSGGGVQHYGEPEAAWSWCGA